ncbi:universal stress protein [Algibacter luteus]|uniref:universal stress protein n=1 Tax=Algibacter luteus TaxID=1178825 RepID=UPI002595436A|nr:universal stress protein [Algibacter luteus]WJJ97816.1 universal stress protein [Algibacter luteus]
MKNILVTLDFEENEKKLIDVATQFAQSFNSKLWLIHITAPDPDFVGYDAGPQYIRDNRAKEIKKEHRQLEDYCRALEKQGMDADGILLQGATTEMIIKKSEKLNIDLIITGHRNRGIFYKALLGSVSSQIIKKSKIPVLVIPLR